MSVALSRQPGADLDRAVDRLATVLAMCEQGRAALVQAVTVVEAKEVLAAISTLEHAVKVRDLNQEAVVAASTLRIRAERRVGELVAEEEMAKPGPRPRSVTDADRSLTLEERGLTKNESSTFQRLASPPAERFERAVDRVVQQAVERGTAVTREAVMREINPTTERTSSDAWKDGDRFKGACDRLAQLADAATDAIRWGHFPSREAADVETTALTLSLRSARDAIARVEQALQRRRGK